MDERASELDDVWKKSSVEDTDFHKTDQPKIVSHEASSSQLL
jgi:hypothetical protein